MLVFAIGSQLLGQDVYDTPEEYDREITRQEQREIRQNLAQQKMAKKSMMEWRKFEAAHKRAHMKSLHHNKKTNRQKRIVTLVAVGVTSYIIGYEMAKDEHKYKKHGWDKKTSDKWRK